MIINRPLVRKEIKLESEERDAIRCSVRVVDEIFEAMSIYDSLEIEYYDEDYSYTREHMLDIKNGLQNLLYLVYIQEGAPNNEDR